MKGGRSIQGVDLLELAERHGTPLYVYDADVVRRQIGRLRSAFPGARILYAAKALSTRGVLELMEAEGLGLDTVSIHEIELGLRAGFAPPRMLFTPSSVPFDEIRAAVELGVLCNLESLSALEKFGRAFGGRAPCCIRIDPHLRDGPGQVARWYDESKFGIEPGRMGEAAEIAAAHGIEVAGLHVHANHVVQDAGVLLRAAGVVFAAARRFPALRLLDFGGGFNVPMRPGEAVPDPADLAGPFLLELGRFRAEYGRALELWFEPGRFLVAECGLLLARVTVVKSSGATTIAGVDTGFHHLVRPKLYGAWHGIRNLTRPEGRLGRTTVVGNLCEGDTLGRDRELPEVREGDLLAIEAAGAYGASMASNYNARPRPPEVLVDGGMARLIRRRETLGDLVATEVAAPR